MAKAVWVIKEVLDARAVVVGTPTINNTMFPSVADLVFYLKGLRPKGRIGAVFGSYGWGGGGTKAVREQLQAAGIELPLEDLQVNYVPHEAEKAKCMEMGRRIAELIKKS